MQNLTKIEPSAKLVADAMSIGQWQGRRQLVANSDEANKIAALEETSRHIRRQILHTINRAQLGHIGGDFSVTDILVTLFEAVLNIDPANPAMLTRDRFILSKGHCAVALYSVFANCGYFSPDRLEDFAKDLSPLNAHPNRVKIPGVETNTGPLGHGLPVAVGCAKGAQLQKQDWRTFVVVGDGELQEGSNWEAAMCAAHQQLGNLTIIVDRNRLQQGATTADTNELEPLADKFIAFGCDVVVIDGHSYAELLQAFTTPHPTKPRVVIANTIKGKGASFMENGIKWHHGIPNPAEYEQALKELAS